MSENKIIDPYAGANTEVLTDAESLGEQVLKPIKYTQAEDMLKWLEQKMREGNFIYMRDLDEPMMREVTGDDGKEGVATTIVIDKMHNRPRRIYPNTMPTIRYP